MTTLGEMYDADRRATDHTVRDLASQVPVSYTALRPATALVQYLCGHYIRQRGCGGCDPGAIEYTREDGARHWTRHKHEWADVTEFGDPERRYVCTDPACSGMYTEPH